MNKIMHVFLEPNNVAVETIGDEVIICLNQGFTNEHSFSFLRLDIDIFDNVGNIIIGMKNPGQFESFYDFETVNITIQEIDGALIGNAEMYYW